MSDMPFTLLFCPLDASKPQECFDWFLKASPGFSQVIALTNKFDPPAGIGKVNIASDYSPEFARIESLASIVRARDFASNAAANSLALFSLQRLVDLRPGPIRVALVRKKMAIDPACLVAAFANQERPFSQLKQDPAVILFDSGQHGAGLSLALAMDTVLSGAIYATESTSLASLVEAAQNVALSTPMQELAASAAGKSPTGDKHS